MSQRSGKKNSFDQFLKRLNAVKKRCWITTSFTLYLWPPSALQAMDIGVGTFASERSIIVVNQSS